MKESSANIMRQNKRVIRAINDPCDASCATWFACANSKPNGVCSGFVLMNGQTRKHLDKILNEDDAIYVQNCVRLIQNGDMSEDKEGLVEEVLRFIPEAERQPKETGFAAMLTAARSSNLTSQHTESAEPRSSSGFLRMLEESSKKTDEDAIQKALDEIEQDEVKHRRQSSEPTKRGMGFSNMLEGARRGTEGDEESQPEKRDRDSQPRLGFLRMLDTTYQQHVENGSIETRIPYGFVSMLESIWPPKPAETLVKRSYIRGMGFANMLRGAAEGTE